MNIDLIDSGANGVILVATLDGATIRIFVPEEETKVLMKKIWEWYANHNQPEESP